MKKIFNWKVVAAITLVILSALFYFIHFLIFRDLHHIFIYLLGDIAFLFLEVLMVSLIIHQLLTEWEKRSHLKKLNMVIEVFFSEFGKHLLVYLSNFDNNLNMIHDLIIDKDGTCRMDFKAAFKAMRSYKADIDMDKVHLHKLSKFLTDRRQFLVNLLQNPNLLEHQTFTETIMAVFHIAEELAARDLKNLSKEDIAHTKTDWS